jgi:hypothetical protein
MGFALLALVAGGLFVLDHGGPATAADTTAINPDHGGSATPFALILPLGAKCSGDSATHGYHVGSYVVDNALVPASQLATMVSWSAGIPSTSNGANVVSLLTVTGTAYQQQPTGVNTGSVGTVPALSWKRFGSGDFGTGLDLYPGTFNVGVACINPAGKIDGDNFWNTQFRFSASTTDAGGFTWALSPFTTTTTLTASPAGRNSPGAAVTLTATITPPTAPGTVTFSSDGVPLGGPVPIVASGGTAVATLVTGSLAVGTHKLTAAYTPLVYTGPQITGTDVYTSSQAAAVTYDIMAESTTTTPGGSTTTSSTAPGSQQSTTSTTSGAGPTGGASSSGGSTSGGSGTGGTGGSGGSSGTGETDPSTSDLAATGPAVITEVVFSALIVFAGLFILSFAVPTGRRLQAGEARPHSRG